MNRVSSLNRVLGRYSVPRLKRVSCMNKVFACLALLIFQASALALTSEVKIEEGYVTTPDGVRLFYQKAGNKGPAIIAPARLFLFDDFKQLADEFTVISYDMRGRGRSDTVADGERLSIHYDVKDLETVRQHFRLSKFNAVGYSYLGLMVVMYAMEHGERIDRIVQIGPVPLKFGTEYPAHLSHQDKLTEAGASPEEIAELEKLREAGFGKTNPKEYCEKYWRVMRFRLVGDPANVGLLGAGVCDMQNEWPVNLARHFQYGFESVKKLDIPKEKVARVRHPVLTIHGTKDRNAPYGAGREWASLLPNARMLTVKNAAHQVFAEHPEVVFAAIRTFFKGKWPSGAEQIEG